MTVVAMKKNLETPQKLPPHGEPKAEHGAVIIPAETVPPRARVARSTEALRWSVRVALPPILGLMLFMLLWAMVSKGSAGLPGPHATWVSAVELFRDPFYDKGPNDQGIGWNILHSLQRVGIGFGLAAALGIPLGFMIGRFAFLNGMTAPINSVVGVSIVPQEYMNVARVLNLSEWKIFTTILFPAVLPYTLTGVRLGLGVAWLVIVAAEMLTGGVGIGFWVWDEWNNLNVAHIIIAIFVVGIVGLILEQALLLLARRFNYE